jgi:hypothetical protein
LISSSACWSRNWVAHLLGTYFKPFSTGNDETHTLKSIIDVRDVPAMSINH